VLAEITPLELSNEARRVLKIIRRLWVEREFTNQGSIEDRRRRYEEKSNPLKLFIKEATVADPNSHIFAFEFRELFNKYCEDKRMRKWNEMAIGKWMREMGYDHQRVQAGDDKRYWAYLGIKWIPAKGCGQMTIPQSRANSGQDGQAVQVLPTPDSYIAPKSEVPGQPGHPGQNDQNTILVASTREAILGIMEKNSGKEVAEDHIHTTLKHHNNVDDTLRSLKNKGDIAESSPGKLILIR
jgi:hypothetical protein